MIVLNLKTVSMANTLFFDSISSKTIDNVANRRGNNQCPYLSVSVSVSVSVLGLFHCSGSIIVRVSVSVGVSIRVSISVNVFV